jgi:flagellar basal body L-ring protein FlgH
MMKRKGRGAGALMPLAGMLLAGAILAPVGGNGLGAQQLPPAEQASTREAPLRASWTSDRHELGLGDIVTIRVDEATLATASAWDSRSQNRNRDLTLQGGVGGQGGGGGATSRADLSDRVRGESTRRELFSTDVSARVVEHGPGGVVRVEGEKRVRIDGHEQIIAISGWLRSADISGFNTVESWRLADAEIRYKADGDMRRVRGLWGRLLGRLWP